MQAAQAHTAGAGNRSSAAGLAIGLVSPPVPSHNTAAVRGSCQTGERRGRSESYRSWTGHAGRDLSEVGMAKAVPPSSSDWAVVAAAWVRGEVTDLDLAEKPTVWARVIGLESGEEAASAAAATTVRRGEQGAGERGVERFQGISRPGLTVEPECLGHPSGIRASQCQSRISSLQSKSKTG